MSDEMIGKEAILGQLRDEGFEAMTVNRVEKLLDAFGGNIQQFVGATRAQLESTYVKKLNPNGKMGLGDKTWETFERFGAIWRKSRLDAKQVAKATVEAQEAKAAEKEAMRLELLDREVEFGAMTSAMAALETLGAKKCKLGRLLELYDMAKEAKAC